MVKKDLIRYSGIKRHYVSKEKTVYPASSVDGSHYEPMIQLVGRIRRGERPVTRQASFEFSDPKTDFDSVLDNPLPVHRRRNFDVSSVQPVIDRGVRAIRELKAKRKEHLDALKKQKDEKVTDGKVKENE